jgi:hypothetical protein
MQIASSNYQHKDPHRGWPEKVETFCMRFESSYKWNFANLKQVLESLGPLKSGTFFTFSKFHNLQCSAPKCLKIFLPAAVLVPCLAARNRDTLYTL